MDFRYLSRVFLKGGTGNRGKGDRALTLTPGFVDASRFRAGRVRLTLFFVVDERARRAITFPSCDGDRGQESDGSARFSEREGEATLDVLIDDDGGQVSDSRHFRFTIPTPQTRPTQFHLISVPRLRWPPLSRP
jgi:hypothetical protein